MDQSQVEVVELAANLDDASGEVLGAAVEALLGAGALDVWTVPIGMKKGRPGVMLCVLCAAERRESMARLMIEQTGTFGVRWRAWERVVVARRHEAVGTAYGAIRVKVGTLGGEVVAVKPEYEDVRAAAERAGVAVREVMDAARAAAERWRAEREGGAA